MFNPLNLCMSCLFGEYLLYINTRVLHMSLVVIFLVLSLFITIREIFGNASGENCGWMIVVVSNNIVVHIEPL